MARIRHPKSPEVKYQHVEAFNVMQYECPKKHVILIWNSRDGVTPFTMLCRQTDCNEIAEHVRWYADRHEPHHQLKDGEYFWRDGTKDEARKILRKRFEGMKADEGCSDIEISAEIEEIVNSDHGEFQSGWPMLDQYKAKRFERVPGKDRVQGEAITWNEIAWRNVETGSILFTDEGKDPNRAIWLKDLYLLFTDQAEYYAVCSNCRSIYGRMQWSGSTRGGPGWQQRAQNYLEWRLKERSWCQFCDPEFGNGGWRLD